MKIELYPSLQFGWDLPQFQTVVKEYLKETLGDEEAPGDEDFEKSCLQRWWRSIGKAKRTAKQM